MIFEHTAKSRHTVTEKISHFPENNLNPVSTFSEKDLLPWKFFLSAYRIHYRSYQVKACILLWHFYTWRLITAETRPSHSICLVMRPWGSADCRPASVSLIIQHHVSHGGGETACNCGWHRVDGGQALRQRAALVACLWGFQLQVQLSRPASFHQVQSPAPSCLSVWTENSSCMSSLHGSPVRTTKKPHSGCPILVFRHKTISMKKQWSLAVGEEMLTASWECAWEMVG